MGTSTRYCLIAVLLICICGVSTARAGWIESGNVVCVSSNSKNDLSVVSDAAGGAIAVWRDNRSSNYDIYAQRLDANGNALWATAGVPVCINAGAQDNVHVVADGAGGAIVVWDDNRNGTLDIYAQRINSAGSTLWTTDGILVIGVAGDQTIPRVALTGTGNCIVAWQGNVSGDFDLRAQKLGSAGEKQWGTNGVSICSTTGDQVNLQILSDGASGAFIFWADGRNGNTHIYAQKVNTEGSVEWAANGVAVCTASGYQHHVSLASSSTGVIATWRDTRSNAGIYAQRISSSGGMLWTANGIAICATGGDCLYPKIVPDGSSGGIIAWADSRSANPFDPCLYAQRVTSAGSVLWTANGAEITSSLGEWESIEDSDPFDLISGDPGEAVFARWDPNEAHLNNVRAGRISPTGSKVWEFTLASGDYDGLPRLASDGAGQFIVAWQDGRNYSDDFYAQMFGANGYWGNQTFSFSVSDVRHDQGGWVRLHMQKTLHDAFADPLPITGYCVWRKRTTSALFLKDESAAVDAASAARETLAGMIEDPARASGTILTKAEAAALAFPAGSWEMLGYFPAVQLDYYDFVVPTKNDSSSAGVPRETFFISAHTPSPSAYIVTRADSGYSVDNLAPGLPHGLAGEQQYTPAGLTLAWHPVTESDLAHYAVYRGTSSGFTPGPSNLIASPTDTATFDGTWRWSGGYYYKVSAIDRHGNESGFALLAPDGVTGTETPKAPDATYLAQNFPNPFNPTTRITFGLKEPAAVSLRIYDAAGRLVRVLVSGSRPAGTYSELWDGRDNGSRSVASGIYFYRLDAGSFSQTRKMALLR